jgi:cytochrome P450
MTAAISEQPTNNRKLREAPFAPGLAIVTDVLEAWRDPLGLMERRVAEYGDVMRMRFAWMGYYVLNHPDAVHHVLVENHRNYQKSRNYKGLKYMLGQGLLTSEGDFWKKQRKLAQPAFHRDSLSKLAIDMVSCTNDMLDRWEKELVPNRPIFDLHREMMRLTLRIVGKTLLSTDLDGEAKTIGDALTVAITWANEHVNSVLRLPPWVPTPNNIRFRRAQKTIDEIALRLIAERRAYGEERTDLLGLLMSAQDEATGEKMNDAQLKDELLTLVLAGHETTANALSFAFHLLAHHPEVEQKLLAEIAQTLGDRTPQLSDLPKMPYTKQVIEESMRLYPPAWVIEREAIEDDVVFDYRIHKNNVVAVFPWLLHQHPKYWQDPQKFDPDRFRPELTETRPKYVYMPFGGGPRMCIGNAFAMMEMQLLLPMIVRRHRFVEDQGFSLALDPTITLRAKSGVSVRIEPR